MAENYPTLSLTQIQKIKTVLDDATNDPKYLDGRICPYDRETRELLKSLIPNPVVSATLSDAGDRGRKKSGAPRKGPTIPTSDLEKEFQELREEIKTLKADAKGLEPNERIQIVKTRAALIEKILSMKERIVNIKKMEEFISQVIQLMEDELPQDLRLKFLNALEPFAEQEG